jgi:hypothetical protein
MLSKHVTRPIYESSCSESFYITAMGCEGVFVPSRLQAAQPNNRIQCFCPAFITPFTEKLDCLTNARIWKVARETETTQAYFYDPIGAVPCHAQVALHAKGLRSADPPAPKP